MSAAYMSSLPRKAETLIQKWVFYNPWLERFVRYKYYTPDSRTPEIPISDRAQHHLNELRENGVTLILYNYYHRQPFYREQPWVIRNALSAELPFDQFSKLEISAKFHTDWYRQITMMLLVNDLTEADTHLEYAVGSHKHWNTWDRYSYAEESITQQFPIMHCVGAKGTLIIMDAGSGFHRGTHRKGTVRKTLQCVITAGHYFPAPEQKMTVTDWPTYSRLPNHVRRMLDDLRLD